MDCWDLLRGRGKCCSASEENISSKRRHGLRPLFTLGLRKAAVKQNLGPERRLQKSHCPWDCSRKSGFRDKQKARCGFRVFRENTGVLDLPDPTMEVRPSCCGEALSSHLAPELRLWGEHSDLLPVTSVPHDLSPET